MPRSSPKPRKKSPADSKLAGTIATLSALPEAALVTRDKCVGGGVEIVFANECFAILTGYPAAELVGKHTRILHGPKTALAPKVSAVSEKRRIMDGENWLHRKDGVAFYADWRINPLHKGYLVAIYRDASERQRLRDAMIHTQKLDTVGQLTSGVAHDFNNLLSIINGYCEILAGKISGPPAAKRDLQEIHRAGIKAAALARQILEFSRRQESEVRVVSVNILIREIADILRRVVGDGVNLELRLSSDLGNLRIDPTQFQQVLLNLCFNARDAMPQGGKLQLRTFNHVQTKAAEGLSPGRYIGIAVTDTGIGMDAATVAHMFEPFFTTKAHGTGLGLAMASGIIRGAEGSMTVESKPEVGTTFQILLPETAEPEQAFNSALPSLPSSKGTELIWIVESDEVLRKMVSGMLAVDGYQVVEYTSAGLALANVGKSAPPHLVLLDGNTGDSARLVRALAKANSRLRILMVSVEPLGAALTGLPPRSVHHLPKPFALSALLRAVRTLLDTPGR